MKFDQEKHYHNNIIPLGNDEIKSILKTQSEAVFEDKNITNKSNFVKKSLIDIAMDFETKERKKETSENTETIKKIPLNLKKMRTLKKNRMRMLIKQIVLIKTPPLVK